MEDRNVELQIVGGIMYDGADVMEILTRNKVDGDWFADRLCRKVWDEAYKLYKLGHPITYPDIIKAAGHSETLEKAVDSWQSIAHTSHLCGKLREYRQRRHLIKAADKIKKAAEDMDNDIEQERSKAELSISDLTTRVDTTRNSIDIVDEAIKDWTLVAEQGSCIGVRTRFKAIDDGFGGLIKSAFYILSGAAGSCKTTLARNIIEHVCEDGHKVGFLSLEQTAQQIWGAMLARYSKQSVFYLNSGRRDRSDVGKLKEVREFVSGFPLTVEERPHTRDEMLSWGRREVSRGAGLLVVDYIQRVQPNAREGGDSEEQRIAKTSTALADLAKETGIPVLAISALSRDDKLRGSGILDYDAYCHLKLSKAADWEGGIDPNLVYEARAEKARFGPSQWTARMVLLGNEGRLIDEPTDDARETLRGK